MVIMIERVSSSWVGRLGTLVPVITYFVVVPYVQPRKGGDERPRGGSIDAAVFAAVVGGRCRVQEGNIDVDEVA